MDPFQSLSFAAPAGVPSEYQGAYSNDLKIASKDALASIEGIAQKAIKDIGQPVQIQVRASGIYLIPKGDDQTPISLEEYAVKGEGRILNAARIQILRAAEGITARYSALARSRSVAPPDMVVAPQTVDQKGWSRSPPLTAHSLQPMESPYSEHIEKIAALAGERAVALEQLEREKAARAALKQELAEARAEIEAKGDKSLLLEVQLSESNDRIADSDARVTSLTEELRTARATLSQFSTQIASLESQLATAAAELQALRSAHDELKTQHSRVSEEHETTRATLGEAQLNLAAARATVQVLQASTSRSGEDNQRLTALLTQAQGELSEATREVTSLSSDKARQEEQLRALSEQMSIKEASIARLQAEQTAQAATIARQVGEIEESNSRRLGAESALSANQDTQRSLQQQIDQLSQTNALLSGLQEQLKHALDKIPELERQIASTEGTNAQLLAQLESLDAVSQAAKMMISRAGMIAQKALNPGITSKRTDPEKLPDVIQDLANDLRANQQALHLARRELEEQRSSLSEQLQAAETAVSVLFRETQSQKGLIEQGTKVVDRLTDELTSQRKHFEAERSKTIQELGMLLGQLQVACAMGKATAEELEKAKIKSKEELEAASKREASLDQQCQVLERALKGQKGVSQEYRDIYNLKLIQFTALEKEKIELQLRLGTARKTLDQFEMTNRDHIKEISQLREREAELEVELGTVRDAAQALVAELKSDLENIKSSSAARIEELQRSLAKAQCELSEKKSDTAETEKYKRIAHGQNELLREAYEVAEKALGSKAPGGERRLTNLPKLIQELAAAAAREIKSSEASALAQLKACADELQSTLETEKASHALEILRLTAEIDNLKAAEQSAKSDYAKAEANLKETTASHSADLAALQDDLARAKRSQAVAEKEKATLSEQLQQLVIKTEEEISSLKEASTLSGEKSATETKELTAQIEALKEKHARETKKLQDQLSEITGVSAKEVTETTLKELSERYAESERVNRAFVTATLDRNATIKSLNDVLTQKEDHIAQLEAELEDAKKENEGLKLENAALKVELAKTQEQLKQLVAASEELVKVNTSLEGKVGMLTEQNAGLAAEVDKLKSRIAELEAFQKAETDEMARLKGSTNNIETIIAKWKDLRLTPFNFDSTETYYSFLIERWLLAPIAGTGQGIQCEYKDGRTTFTIPDEVIAEMRTIDPTNDPFSGRARGPFRLSYPLPPAPRPLSATASPTKYHLHDQRSLFGRLQNTYLSKIHSGLAKRATPQRSVSASESLESFVRNCETIDRDYQDYDRNLSEKRIALIAKQSTSSDADEKARIDQELQKLQHPTHTLVSSIGKNPKNTHACLNLVTESLFFKSLPLKSSILSNPSTLLTLATINRMTNLISSQYQSVIPEFEPAKEASSARYQERLEAEAKKARAGTSSGGGSAGAGSGTISGRPSPRK